MLELRLLSSLIAVALCGCGGGSGGGGNSAPPPMEPSLTVSTNQASKTAVSSDALAVLTLQATVANTTSTPYIVPAYTQNAIVSVDAQAASGGKWSISVTFMSPQMLPVGTYSDTITLNGCYDLGCNLTFGTPQVVAVQLIVAANSSTPVVISVSPQVIVNCGMNTVLTIRGANFGSDSSLILTGSNTQFGGVIGRSPTLMTAKVAVTDCLSSGTFGVAVADSLAGTGVSAPVPLTIAAAPPPQFSVEKIGPTTVTSGATDWYLTVVGSGYMPGVSVQWNGAARTTTMISSTELLAAIPASDVASPGTATVTVVNGGSSPQTSSPISVQIVPPSLDAVTYQIDATHAATIAFQNVTLPTSMAWQVSFQGSPSYALIAQGKVFVTVWRTDILRAELWALDQSTGATVWGPVTLNGPSNAVYDRGLVLALTYNPSSAGTHIQAFDASTGSLAWSQTLLDQQGFFTAPPTVSFGTLVLYGAQFGATAYAFDSVTGDALWINETDFASGGEGAAAISTDGVYFGSATEADDLNVLTGQLMWQYRSSGTGGGGISPVVANGVVYTINPRGGQNGVALGSDSGTALWNYSSFLPPAVDSQHAYFVTPTGTLESYSGSTATPSWSFSGDGGLCTSPIVVNQYVFVGSSSGNLYAIDAASGQQLWQVNVGAEIPRGAYDSIGMQFSSLNAGDGLLIVPAGNTLTAFVLSSNP